MSLRKRGYGPIPIPNLRRVDFLPYLYSCGKKFSAFGSPNRAVPRLKIKEKQLEQPLDKAIA
jgi:hypothetical protein